MSEQCGKQLRAYRCARDLSHAGACRAETGHWWAQFDSGRTDMEPYHPLTGEDDDGVKDMRRVWV